VVGVWAPFALGATGAALAAVLLVGLSLRPALRVRA